MEQVVMGRPKKSPRPEPSPSFSMKGDAEWVTWVEELAAFLNTTKAGVIDRALIELARFVGFKKAPPPRFKKR